MGNSAICPQQQQQKTNKQTNKNKADKRGTRKQQPVIVHCTMPWVDLETPLLEVVLDEIVPPSGVAHPEDQNEEEN